MVDANHGFPALCGIGWNALLLELKRELNSTPDLQQVRIISAKEKFGELRLRWIADENVAGVEDTMGRLVEKYRSKSRKTCEICGSAGALVFIGQQSATRCRTHLTVRRESDL